MAHAQLIPVSAFGNCRLAVLEQAAHQRMMPKRKFQLEGCAEVTQLLVFSLPGQETCALAERKICEDRSEVLVMPSLPRLRLPLAL